MIAPPLRLFEAFGVELEYMIVHRDSLDVFPVADRVLGLSDGDETEVDRGDLCWSNELVLHVVELKTNGPASSLDGLEERFQRGVGEVARALEPLGGRLMPGAMHPWMDPRRETVLWPHGNREIYEAFDRIFGCQGHGWSNLQSAHLNLPFHGDDEFGRLHAAVRLVLPILPALAAASPIVELHKTGLLDNRLDVYRTNCRRIPSVTGRVIPEPVFTEDEYRREILQPMYEDIAPHDSAGILQYEWLNARGAIARFERDTIEVRVLDVQECPKADLAVLWAAVETIRGLAEERWTSLDEQQTWGVARLEHVLRGCTRDADEALIADRDYLGVFGFDGDSATAGSLWRHIVGRLPDPGPHRETLDFILDRGPLARRILRALDGEPAPGVGDVYAALCDCLEQGTVFGK
jgi:gamma-glutamyl:cysteine ligase YbdK (ATP-grasp superfamily)